MTISELLHESITLWHRCSTDLPDLGRVYSPAEQAEREERLDRALAVLQAQVRKVPRSRSERHEAHARISDAFMDFARDAMDMDKEQRNLLFEGGFSGIGSELGRQARRFDPGVQVAGILQACRNAWAACGLQSLFGCPMEVTPAIFAYSMLYPYTDNFLDDETVGREKKIAFTKRLRSRLEGDSPAPMGTLEKKIFDLVGMIEGQYARPDYHDVYASLLAIHQAQEESIRLLRRSGAPDADIERVVFAKGGSSVLVDACLAIGSLSEEQARFAFQWGVLLQLGDDLQDVHEDRESCLFTLFSSLAGNESLDRLTSRTLHLACIVLDRLESVSKGPAALKELLRNSSMSLIVRAVGAAADLHSASYIAAVERYSPFRFAFLRQRRNRLGSQKQMMEKFFEAFLEAGAEEPSFPLFPSSLMPRFGGQ